MRYLILVLLAGCYKPVLVPVVAQPDVPKLNFVCCEECIKGGNDFGFIVKSEPLTCACFKKDYGGKDATFL